MKRDARRFIVTGASGYLGEHLCRHLRSAGHAVHEARRSGADSTDAFAWSIGDDVPVDLLGDDTTVVHLAAGTRPTQRGVHTVPETDPEVLGARALLRQTEASGARLVFASSQSAAPDAPSHYGRIKWAIQQDVLASAQVALQLGLVHGGSDRGLYGRLRSLAQRLPIVPVPFPSPRIQLTPIEWACCSIERLGNGELPGGLYAVAQPQPVRFRRLLAAFAEESGRRRIFLPVPTAPFRWLWRSSRGVAWPKLVALDQLMALMDSADLDTAASLRRLGLDGGFP